MGEQHKVSAYIALLILLVFGICVNIFPILAVVPMSGDEIKLMDLVKSMQGSGISAVLDSWNGGDVVNRCYAYTAMLFLEIADWYEPVFWLRFPTAIIISILTLSLFRFDRSSEPLGNSFIASLVFMGCMYVEALCITATPILIPAVLTIISLVSMYHWLRRPNTRNVLLMIAAVTASMLITGTMSLLFAMILGLIMIYPNECRKIKPTLQFLFYLVMSCVAVYVILFMITGSKSTALALFRNFTALSSIGFEDSSTLYIFMYYVIMSIFPWSVPLLISLPWAIKNHRRVYDTIMSLSRIQRFGILVYIVSLPLFLFYSQYSYVLLLASVFFNAPLVGRILIWQFNHHPIAWKISGMCCAVVALVIVILFVLLNNGIDVFGVSLSAYGWSLWNVILVVAIVVSVYSLSRNKREIHRNHRFFFNLIILYLLVQNLIVGYLYHSISF